LGNVSGRGVANQRIKRRNQSDGLADTVCQALRVGGDRFHAVVGQNHASALQVTRALVEAVRNNGFKRVELKLSSFGRKGDSHIVAKDFKGNLADRFRNDGIDFARHDGGARLAWWQIDLADASAWAAR